MRSLASIVTLRKFGLFRYFQAWKVRLWLRFDVAALKPGGFLTWHRRPKKLSNWPRLPAAQNLETDVGIVIQGPLVHKFNFTLETIRLYRSLNPNAELVISTWVGLEASFLQECNRLGVHVVENEPLADPHYGNLNRQQLTTLAGLSKLRELGVSYAIKTRTDQRIYNPHFVNELRVAERFFPPLKFESKSNKSRIFLTYQNSFRDRYLSGSDFLQFGLTNELIDLWVSIDTKRMPTDLAPEQILIGNYLLKLGAGFENLVSERSWKIAIGRVFGFIEPAALDLFWLKYSSREYLWRKYGDEHLREISSSDWYSAMLESQGLKG